MLKNFIKKAKQIHGNKYDYSLVNYINSKTKVKIICKKHGIFKQTPNNHTSKANKNGCPKCKYELLIKKCKLKLSDFIKKAKNIHNNKYKYNFVIYKGIYKKIKIICPVHGAFKQVAHDHLKGRGCPKCNQSKGEKIIEQYLKEHDIKYISQYKFKDCRNKRSLPFDFYLPDYNTCIEYDGEQHFKPINFSFNKLNKNQIIKQFNQIKQNDLIKTNYCKYNKIKLVRIPYFKINNINKILNFNINYYA